MNLIIKFFIRFWQNVRRRLYPIFRKRYLIESLNLRQGKCLKCGYCCGSENLFSPPCKHFKKKTKECKVYNSNEWLVMCNNPPYPFDEFDKNTDAKDKCGYYWWGKK
jgi:hypothetical protein